VTFPDVETNQQSPVNLTRTKRQLAEQAIAQASAAQWEDAARHQPQAAGARPGPRSGEPPRQGALGAGLARRGPRALSDRPRARPDEPHRGAQHRPPQGPAQRGRREDRAAQDGSKAPVSIFVEETGKTGLRVPDGPAPPKELAQVNPGRLRRSSRPRRSRLIALSNGVRIGVVEPRVAARCLKLIADGNKYARA
jgi:hypothetical protein